MLQQRRMAAQQVADSLFESEAAIDAAITAVAKLAGVMPAVRSDARLSALIGQGALERAIEAMGELGSARRAIVETHKELSIAQRDIGLGAIAFGGAEEKPKEGPVAGLAVVQTGRQAA